MGLLSWCLSLISWYRRPTVLFTGLDNSGKTTLLQVLHQSEAVSSRRLIPRAVEELSVLGFDIRTIEVSLQGSVNYSYMFSLPHFARMQIRGVVFVVDGADAGRIQEAKSALDNIRCSFLDNIPIVILLNKTDLEHSETTSTLCAHLGIDLTSIYPPGSGRMAVFPVSCVHRSGFRDAFQWLLPRLPK